MCVCFPSTCLVVHVEFIYIKDISQIEGINKRKDAQRIPTSVTFNYLDF